MKKLILLLGLLLCISACTDYRNEYKCTIVYELDGVEHTESYLIESGSSTPAYVYTDDELMVVTVPYCHNKKTVYKGSLKLRVISFNYEKIRTFKVSTFDGHEIK